MKTWSKADLLSLFLVILGIISLIFSTSNLLPIFSFMLASVILLHCVYNSRYELLKFRDFYAIIRLCLLPQMVAGLLGMKKMNI